MSDLYIDQAPRFNQIDNCFSLIPEDFLLKNIFNRYFSVFDYLKSLDLVSKSFHERTIKINKLSFSKNPILSNKNIKDIFNFTWVEKLDLSLCKYNGHICLAARDIVSAECIQRIAENFYNLKSFKLSHAHKLDAEDFIYFFERFKNQLTEFILFSCRNIRADSLSAFLIEAIHLKKLRLSNLLSLSDHNLINLVGKLQKLEYLDVSSLKTLTRVSIIYVIQNLDYLKSLNIVFCLSVNPLQILDFLSIESHPKLNLYY